MVGVVDLRQGTGLSPDGATRRGDLDGQPKETPTSLRAAPLRSCQPAAGAAPSANQSTVTWSAQCPRPGHDSADDHDVGPRLTEVRLSGGTMCASAVPGPSTHWSWPAGGGRQWSGASRPARRDPRAGRTRTPRRCPPPRGGHRSRRSRPGSACVLRPGLPPASTAHGRASPARTRRSRPRPHASRLRRAQARPPSEGCRRGAETSSPSLRRVRSSSLPARRMPSATSRGSRRRRRQDAGTATER